MYCRIKAFRESVLFPCLIIRWLDSSKTLYEQDVKEHDLLYLRFKYYSFMDIDPRVSNQLESIPLIASK